MARAHFVKKARKNNKAAGIKKGESYWWWKFRHGGKRFSKTQPRQSQLTQSEFMSAFYAIQESIEDSSLNVLTPDDLESVAEAVRQAAEEMRELASDCESKADNMESAFPNGNPTIELLRNRAEQCEAIADQLDDAAGEIAEEPEPDYAGHVSGALDSVSWDVE